MKKKQMAVNAVRYTKEQKAADDYLNSVINAAQTIFDRGNGAGSFGVSPDGKRNYNELFGYGENLDYSDYKAMYLRGGFAKTVVDKLPKACWRDMPELKVGDNLVLVEDLKILKKFKFFKALENADILNRIGRYSVLLIGIPDGLELHLPVGSAKKGAFKDMYFRAYSEDGITITKVDNDPASPRYQLPELYTLQTINTDATIAQQSTSIVVHHSRIVHFAEGSLESSIEGRSCLEAPYNALIDKDKIRGASAESYYRNSRQKLALETNDGAKMSTDPAVLTALKDNVKQFQNGFEDTLRLSNMKANMLQPQIASPREAFDIAAEDVAGTTGIPIRILTTKAGGSVTGSEDKATWNGLVIDRQDQECTCSLLDALQIIADAGIIDLPENVDVIWPVQSALSEKESAEAASKKASAFKAVAEGLSTLKGDEILAESVFKEIGLDGIELDDLDLSDNGSSDNKTGDKYGEIN